MKAIQVKFLGATDSKGTRVKAFIKGHSVTEPFCYGGTYREQAVHVAEMLMKKLEWNDVKILGHGTLPNGEIACVIG